MDDADAPPFNVEEWHRETSARRGALLRSLLREQEGRLPSATAIAQRVLHTRGFSRFEALAFGIAADVVGARDPQDLHGPIGPMVDSWVAEIHEDLSRPLTIAVAAVRRFQQAETEEAQVTTFLDLVAEILAQVKGAPPSTDDGA